MAAAKIEALRILLDINQRSKKPPDFKALTAY